jgi:cytochrome c oxidase subunit 4
MSRARGRESVVLAPVLAWAGLLVALGATLGYAFLPGAPAKPVVALGIAAVKAGLIGVVFMRLDRAAPFVRLAAAAGFLWAAILFLLGFVDYLSRVS